MAYYPRRCQRLPLHGLDHLRTPMQSTRNPNRRGVLAAGTAFLAAPMGHALAAGDIAGGKPITLVVSYPAGGGADVMARLIAPRMAEALGQPVVVDNKPGASSTIAAGQVARATPRRLHLVAGRIVVRRQPCVVRQAALRPRGELRTAGRAGAVPERAGVYAELRGQDGGRRAAFGPSEAGRAGLCILRQWLGAASGRHAVRGAGPGRHDAHPLPWRRAGSE